MEENTIDVDLVVSKIQNILNKEHTEEHKREIKYFPSRSSIERINFACPICSDSAKSDYKKRGNVYLANMMYKCFNCGEYTSFINICDTFNEKIEIEDRLKIYEYVDAHVTYNKTDQYFLDNLDKLINIEDWINYYNTSPASYLIDIKPVQTGSQVHHYLKGRFINDFQDIYQGIYRKKRENKTYYYTNVLISLNRTREKIVGFQLRNIETERKRRFYKIVEFDEIYNFMNPGKPIDETEAIIYNKLSHFYNILNVDFEQDVTVFEGFIDTKFYPNSVGLVGANSTNDILNFLLNAEDVRVRFFFDYDKDGVKKSLELIDRGYSVFLWRKLFDAISKNKDKFQAEQRFKRIIDLNNLVEQVKSADVYERLKLYNYFSIDEFDKFYLGSYNTNE